MTSLSVIADKWASNNEIDFHENRRIKDLKNPRKIQIVRQIYNDDKKHFHPPSYFCNEIKGNEKKTFNKELFKQLSNYLELNIRKWMIEAASTDLIDLIMKCVQAIVDINRPNSDPIFEEDDVIDIYNCIWIITGNMLRDKLIQNDHLVELLFFSIIPSYTKLFTIILKILSDLIINNPEKFYGSLIISMELTAQIQNSPTIFKWIIDTLSPSRGMNFINTTLDFLLAILNGTGEDSPQKYRYEALMVKDGIVDKLKQFIGLLGNQDDNISDANNSINTFIRLIQLHQNVIFSLFEFDITKETDCRVNMFNPLDTSSCFEFLSQLVNDNSLMNSFLLSTIDINNHTTTSYIRHLNKINYYTRIALHQGYSFEDAFTKAVQMDIDLNIDIPKSVDESSLSIPSNITDFQMQSDFQNLYSNISCEFQFTGFWDLPDEPEEMKYLATLEERKQIILKAEKLRILTIEQEESLKKHELRKTCYESKLKQLLGEEEYSKFLNQVDNGNFNVQINPKIPVTPIKTTHSDSVPPLVPPPPPPPPPPASSKGVKPLTPPYSMEYCINVPKVDLTRIPLTIWNEIVPNEINIDFQPLEFYLRKDASQKKATKSFKKQSSHVISSDFDMAILIPFKNFKDRCKKFDEKEILNQIKQSNQEIDDQNRLNNMVKQEIFKRQVNQFRKSLLTINKDGVISDSFLKDLMKLMLPKKNEKKSLYDETYENIIKITSNPEQFQIQFDILSQEFQTDSGLLIKTLVGIPNLKERLEFIMLLNLYKEITSKAEKPINDAKNAFNVIRYSEKFKHFLEMSLKIINMMGGTNQKKNNKSGVRGFKLGFINQFTTTEERRKNLEGFWIASENDESVKGFMEDISLFKLIQTFNPGQICSQFEELNKSYCSLKNKIEIIKEKVGSVNSNDNNIPNFDNYENSNEIDENVDRVYIISCWEKFDNDYGHKIPQYLIDFKNDCEKMYDVMIYFDQCELNKNDKFGQFKDGAKEFIDLICQIHNAMLNAQKRILERAEKEKRKAKILLKSTKKQPEKMLQSTEAEQPKTESTEEVSQPAELSIATESNQHVETSEEAEVSQPTEEQANEENNIIEEEEDM